MKLSYDIKHMLCILGCAAGALGFLTSCERTKDKQDDKLVCSIEGLRGTNNMIHIAVIGGGSAGLSAGIGAARMGFPTVIFAGNGEGSLLYQATLIENWPGVAKCAGMDILNTLQEQATNFGASFIPKSITDIDFSRWPFTLTMDDGEIVHALAVIIATGAAPKKLGIKGEDEYWGKGVANCSKCDAPLTKDQRVIIVGEDHKALDHAILIAQYTRDVTVLVRDKDMMIPDEKKDSLNEYPFIKIAYQTQLEEIMGDDKVVTGAKIRNLANNRVENIPVEWVFEVLGNVPNTRLFEHKVPLRESGHIVLAQGTQQTEIPGVFAAGLVADTRYKQAAIASGDGSKAAHDAVNFLQKFDNELEQITTAQLYGAKS